MNANDVAAIAAKIMYISDASIVEHNKSLFNVYAMSSIDFIDFAFEIGAESGETLSPNYLWPVNSLMTDPVFFEGLTWTSEGVRRLCEIFRRNDISPDISVRELYEFFTIEYVTDRLVTLE